MLKFGIALAISLATSCRCAELLQDNDYLRGSRDQTSTILVDVWVLWFNRQMADISYIPPVQAGKASSFRSKSSSEVARFIRGWRPPDARRSGLRWIDESPITRRPAAADRPYWKNNLQAPRCGTPGTPEAGEMLFDAIFWKILQPNSMVVNLSSNSRPDVKYVKSWEQTLEEEVNVMPTYTIMAKFQSFNSPQIVRVVAAIVAGSPPDFVGPLGVIPNLSILYLSIFEWIIESQASFPTFPTSPTFRFFPSFLSNWTVPHGRSSFRLQR